MNSSSDNNRRQKAEDVVKGVLQWVVVSALGFGYWLFVLLLASLFLMNIWVTSWEQILRYGIVLGILTSVVYGGVLIYRRMK